MRFGKDQAEYITGLPWSLRKFSSNCPGTYSDHLSSFCAGSGQSASRTRVQDSLTSCLESYSPSTTRPSHWLLLRCVPRPKLLVYCFRSCFRSCLHCACHLSSSSSMANPHFSNGVLQPYAQLNWWVWMYRLSPYTYLIEAILGQGSFSGRLVLSVS